jgi:hypothetical protein
MTAYTEEELEPDFVSEAVTGSMAFPTERKCTPDVSSTAAVAGREWVRDDMIFMIHVIVVICNLSLCCL